MDFLQEITQARCELFEAKARYEEICIDFLKDRLITQTGFGGDVRTKMTRAVGWLRVTAELGGNGNEINWCIWFSPYDKKGNIDMRNRVPVVNYSNSRFDDDSFFTDVEEYMNKVLEKVSESENNNA